MQLKTSKNKKAESPIELYTSLTYNLFDYFEWDENKREINIRKHGIDFIRALDIFEDVKRIERLTIKKGELRIEAIGQVIDSIIFVVYVHRDDKKRIISARKASRMERKLYES